MHEPKAELLDGEHGNGNMKHALGGVLRCFLEMYSKDDRRSVKYELFYASVLIGADI